MNRGKIKVLYLSHQTDFGGGEVALLRFVKYNKQVEPIIVTPQGRLKKRLESKGYQIYTSKGLKPLQRKDSIFWFLSFLLQFIISFYELFRISLRERPEIIHANSIATALYVLLPSIILRIPVVCHIHAPAILEDDFGEEDIRVIQVLKSKVSKFILVSQAVKKKLVEKDLPEEKLEVVYNGIDYKNVFNPKNIKNSSSLRSEYNVKNNKLIGMVSAVSRRKGIYDFLQAANQVTGKFSSQGLSFFVVGKTQNKEGKKYKRKLVQFTKNNNLEGLVYFTGFRKDISAVLSDLDILVHASNKPENLPTILLEALAMEKIIIASKTGGVPEIIDNGENGLLYEPGNNEDLARKIIWCLNNFEKTKQLGKKGRKTVKEKFGIDTQERKLLNLYRKAIK